MSGDDSGDTYIWWCVMVNNQLLGDFDKSACISLCSILFF